MDDDRTSQTGHGHQSAIAGPDGTATPVTLPTDIVPEPRPDKLAPCSRILHGPNPNFVGREESFKTLARALNAGAAAVIHQHAVITGSGGIGKTQLAAEAALRYGPFFPGGVFWISFADPNAIPAEIADCGLAMGLDKRFSTLAVADQVALVKSHWHGPRPCLLVFDNCEDPALLKDWRPRIGASRVIVTSRHGTWDEAVMLALSTLPRDKSLDLLGRHRPDLAGQKILDKIAAELGDFPLALHLAGSFLKKYPNDHRGDPARYLEDLRRRDPLVHLSLTKGETPTDHDPHVARTFAASVERLEPTDIVDTTALSALTHAAFLAPGEPVPLWLLAQVMGQGEDEDAQARLVDATTRLRDLGLVEVDPQGAPILHRLIAAYARQRAEDAAAVWDAVADAVLEAAYEQNEEDLPGPLLAWQAHLRHVAELAATEGGERAGALLNALGYHLDMIADYGGAKKTYERTLAVWEAVLGPEHPRVATAVNNLGLVLRRLGDLPAARRAFERALAIDDVIDGMDNSTTAIHVNNLGLVLMELRDLTSARTAFKRALAIIEKVFGTYHPQAAISTNNLGHLHQELGDLSAARFYYERALAICEATLRSNHPQIATVANNLGSVLQHLGDLNGARKAFERALSVDKSVYGENHPEVATILNNLGMLLLDLGESFEAQMTLTKALGIFERTFGANHPHTQTVRENLTILFR